MGAELGNDGHWVRRPPDGPNLPLPKVFSAFPWVGVARKAGKFCQGKFAARI